MYGAASHSGGACWYNRTTGGYVVPAHPRVQTHPPNKSGQVRYLLCYCPTRYNALYCAKIPYNTPGTNVCTRSLRLSWAARGMERAVVPSDRYAPTRLLRDVRY
eukprot:3940955-Rhodomonas_salina.1